MQRYTQIGDQNPKAILDGIINLNMNPSSLRSGLPELTPVNILVVGERTRYCLLEQKSISAPSFKRGKLCLLGGRLEEEDENNFEQAVLRELKEELTLNGAELEFVGLKLQGYVSLGLAIQGRVGRTIHHAFVVVVPDEYLWRWLDRSKEGKNADRAWLVAMPLGALLELAYLEAGREQFVAQHYLLIHELATKYLSSPAGSSSF